MMSITSAKQQPTAIGINEATVGRDRRTAEQQIDVWEHADDLWGIGTSADDDYSEYIVYVRDSRCTCDDWRYRGDTSSGDLMRCMLLARIGVGLGEFYPLADADVNNVLEAQQERWSA